MHKSNPPLTGYAEPIDLLFLDGWKEQYLPPAQVLEPNFTQKRPARRPQPRHGRREKIPPLRPHDLNTAPSHRDGQGRD